MLRYNCGKSLYYVMYVKDLDMMRPKSYCSVVKKLLPQTLILCVLREKTSPSFRETFLSFAAEILQICQMK